MGGVGGRSCSDGLVGYVRSKFFIDSLDQFLVF